MKLKLEPELKGIFEVQELSDDNTALEAELDKILGSAEPIEFEPQRQDKRGHSEGELEFLFEIDSDLIIDSSEVKTVKQGSEPNAEVPVQLNHNHNIDKQALAASRLLQYEADENGVFNLEALIASSMVF